MSAFCTKRKSDLSFRDAGIPAEKPVPDTFGMTYPKSSRHIPTQAIILCKRWDTPLNDDADMNAIILSALEQCDAVIMVIMADSPFADSEEEFLKNHLLTSSAGQIIFVVNGTDRLNNPTDVKRIVNLIQTRIESSILKWIDEKNQKETQFLGETFLLRKFGKPKVFALSAFQALEAKEKNDHALLNKSGFSEFESALEKILTEERGGILLQVSVNQVIRVCMEMIKMIGNPESAVDSINSQVSILQSKTTEILDSIQSVVENVKNQAHTLCFKIEKDKIKEEFKQAAKQVIESTPVIPDEFNKDKEGFQSEMSAKIADALQNASRKFSKEIERELHKVLMTKWEQTRNFAYEISEHVTLSFRFEMTHQEIETLHKKATDIMKSVNQGYDAFIMQELCPFAIIKLSESTFNILKMNMHWSSFVKGDAFVAIVKGLFFGYIAALIASLIGFVIWGDERILGLYAAVLTFGVCLISAIRSEESETMKNIKADKFKELYLPKVIERIQGLHGIREHTSEEKTRIKKRLELFNRDKKEIERQITVWNIYNKYLDDYVSQVFKPLEQLHIQIGQDVTALTDILHDMLNKRQQASQTRSEIQKILSRYQKLSEQLEPIMRG